MADRRQVTSAGSVEAVERPSQALSREQLLEMYYYVRLTRDIEERLTLFYRQGKVVGGLYRSVGQEGESVASAYALESGDALGPLIRNLGAIIARGVRPRDIYAQLLGRGTSPTRGRDRHFSHLPSPDADEPIIIGPISMLGDLIPVLAGVTLGSRLQGKRRVGLTYIGDGGTSTGAFHEGLNFAAVQKLPLVVLAEDNKYAYSTPVGRQMAIAQIDQRAAAYGIVHEMVDGNDMLAVYDATKGALDRARAGGGPVLIGVDTMRMAGHAEHDDMRYVPQALLDRWRKRDPISRYRAWLLKRAVTTQDELCEIERMSKSCAEDEASLAEQAPMPDPAMVEKGVYAGDDYVQPRAEIVRSPFANAGPRVGHSRPPGWAAQEPVRGRSDECQ